MKADVGGMVDEAVEESRDGNILARVARDLTGGEEDAQVGRASPTPDEAVDGLVARVEKGVNRPAQDAKVNFPSLTRGQGARRPQGQGRQLCAAASSRR